MQVNGDVLCACLNAQRLDLFGSDPIDAWPNVRLYPFSDALSRSVAANLKAYLKTLQTKTSAGTKAGGGRSENGRSTACMVQ